MAPPLYQSGMRAADIAKALGGRRVGRGYSARCPAHDDQSPSLSISDGEHGVLIHCHARCDQAAVIKALCNLGLWERGGNQADRPFVPSAQRESVLADDRDKKKLRAARAIWAQCTPLRGTLAEAYLASRGIRLAAPTPSLRFHPSLAHSTEGRWPAMVASVERGHDGQSLGIHRTFLARDGSGKAPVKPNRLMLGRCQGGAVRLGGAGDVLLIGEGIETSLAASMLYGLPAWSALSTSGLRGLSLPDDVLDVVVVSDGDDAGEAAAHDCASRWVAEGRRVRVARPPQGSDFNDLLIAMGGST